MRTLDIAKRLIDYGFYPPTVYFPLVVDECLMVEPTETEDKETLEEYAAAPQAIAREVVDGSRPCSIGAGPTGPTARRRGRA